jgi:uncharacterized protein YyaL (SSP411 family)
MPAKPNRLAAETSPYLLQHAYNPVDWYAWGPEALARAALADRPIFLSIGYAACHWCHVMERESFEDKETAALLNSGFVPIKVDREERPDLDAVYMDALQVLTGAGGWPMSLFLMPDGRPFYGGTYFPREPRYGMASFRQVLAAVSRSWRERRDELEVAADQLVDQIRGHAHGHSAAPETPAAPLDLPTGTASVAVGAIESVPWSRLKSDRREVVSGAVGRIVDEFDVEHGGWAGPPRFPQPAVIELLLRRARSAPDARVLGTATRALEVMADGGIHDQLGGGFHRYATDTNWLVPHFEKMLYDNAQLARVYLHAYQLTGEQRFRTVAETTLDYMVSELRTPDGLFAASQDADTAGLEGGTYVWTPDEVETALGWMAADPGLQLEADVSSLAALFGSAYGVTEAGNWDGATIVSRVMSDDEAGASHGLAPAEVANQLAIARRILLERRRTRPQPTLDDKAVAAWNGLALAAFAEAVPVLGRHGDLAVAEKLAHAVLGLLRGQDGRLARSFRSGRTAGRGGLDDYACLADGLLCLYEATFDEGWLTASRELVDVIERQFADPDGGWFDTATDAEPLIVRPKQTQDGAAPSGGASAAEVILRLAELTGEGRHRDLAERAVDQMERRAQRYPLAFPAWLGALDFASSPDVTQVAIVGGRDAADARALLGVARAGFQPYRLVALGDSGASTLELLHDRAQIDGRATAFVCRDFACRLPVTEPEQLAADLA